MRETKELLLNLQELDDQIDRLKAEEESIPEKKHDLEESLEAHQASVGAAKKESVELAKKRKELEIELEAGNTNKDRFKHQLFQVKSNREYEALQHEITALEEKNSGLEDKILEIMDRSEQISRQISEEEQSLKAETAKVGEARAKLDKEQEDLRHERKRLVVDMDATLLKRYDRIRANKGGRAVTTVNTGACGGCHRRIPPHEMQNLKRDDKIIMCEGCGRILIWRWE
jgi:predicted  nucleic acid-binding Zn-ribbon protein